MRRVYDGLITFDSTHQALGLETILDTYGLDFDIRPIPQLLSAGCGLAIEFRLIDLDVIKQVIIDNQTIYKAIYKKQDKQYNEIQKN